MSFNASSHTGALTRRGGNLDKAQSVADSPDAWRAFACMVPFTASDTTPLLMVYGGTNSASAKDPLKVAKDGLSGLLVFDTSKNKWHSPNTANAPSSGPILPGCGASPGSIWVYDPQYGQADKEAMTVSLLDSVHWSWSAPSQQGQLPVTRFGAAFAYVPSAQGFFMHGGIPLSGNSNTAENPPGIANNLDVLSPSSLSWSYKSNGPARKYHTLCYLSSIDSVVLFGGSDQNVASYNDVKMFSIKKGTWTYDVVPSGRKPAERILHSAVCSDDSMYVFGGLQSAKSAPSDSTVWVLKASSDGTLAWSTAPISSTSQSHGPTARAGHSAALLNNNMYIYGGIGPSGQDTTMYKLDLTTWEWSKTAASGSSSDSGNSSGTSNKVLIAAIVSSVLGVICIGIAAVIFYRWNRRRGATPGKNTAATADGADFHSSSQAAGEGSEDREGKGPNALLSAHNDAENERLNKADSYTQAAGGLASDSGADVYRKQTIHDYSYQYEDPDFLKLVSSVSTAVHHRNASEVVASNYLPSPHANPSLESSITSFITPLQTGPGASNSGSNADLYSRTNRTPDTARNSAATLDTPEKRFSRSSDSPQHANAAGSRSPGSSPSSYSHAEAINDILLSGRPIPEWLRDAVNRASSSEPSSPLLTPASGLPGRLIVRNLDDVQDAKTSKDSLSNGADPRNEPEVANRSTDRQTATKPATPATPSGRASVHSDTTNDAHSSVLGEPIRYIEPSLGSADEYSIAHDMDSTLNWPTLEPIASPLAPPIPPHMNSLYGELEHTGIIVGQAGIPATSIAAGRVATRVSRPHVAARSVQPDAANEHESISMQDTILSPLDRLAQYHNLDAWMETHAHKQRASHESECANSDGTSQIYEAQPVRQSSEM